MAELEQRHNAMLAEKVPVLGRGDGGAETALLLEYKKAQGKLAADKARLEARLEEQEQEHAHFVAQQQQAVEQVKRDIREECRREAGHSVTEAEAAWQQKLHVATAEGQRAAQKVQQANEQIASLQLTNDTLQEQLRQAKASAQASMKEADARQASLCKEIGNLQAQLDEGAQARAALDRANASLQVANSSLQLRLAQVVEEHAQVRCRRALTLLDKFPDCVG